MMTTGPVGSAYLPVGRSRFFAAFATALVFAGAMGCGGGNGAVVEKCDLKEGDPAPDYVQKVGCKADFLKLASVPLDSSIPGARSGKVVLDTFNDKDELYFQNSVKFQIHYEFVSEYLSGPSPVGGPSHPLVPPLSEFNTSEYYSAERRFVLGAITYYEGSDTWALELAPYDTATPVMIEKLFKKIKAATFYGSKLVFHPTSDTVAAAAKKLSGIPLKTTDEIYAGIEYQPLNLGSSIGKLRFVNAADLSKIYLNFRDIVVLDRVPNDISVVVGMITEEFQTPLSHVNVLAQNRGTPNMGLKKATTNEKLRALDGQWVQLTVGSSEWSIEARTMAEADAWWDKYKPKPVIIPDMDLSETRIQDISLLVDESDNKVGLDKAIKKAILAFGGKAANYSVLANTPGVPVRKAFAIPVFYYDQFMKQNGFYERVDKLLEDQTFKDSAEVRDRELAKLRADMEKAPVDPTFSAMLKTKLEKEFPGLTMRFRTSTNAEDQEDFLCAGCYDSHTGDPANWEYDRPECTPERNNPCSVLQAIRKTWSGVWYFRTFEERSYNSIDQKKIGMALLVHHNFPNETANGVAITANIFDSSGLEPAFYINVQAGGWAEVVAPPPGVFSDQLLLFYSYSGAPITYLAHSNLVPSNQTVLTEAQVRTLGKALAAIHTRFSPAYGPLVGNTGFYGLEVDFKFVPPEDKTAPDQTPELYIKQARNYRGRGM